MGLRSRELAPDLPFALRHVPACSKLGSPHGPGAQKQGWTWPGRGWAYCQQGWGSVHSPAQAPENPVTKIKDIVNVISLKIQTTRKVHDEQNTKLVNKAWLFLFV